MMFLCAMLCGVLMQTKVIEAATNTNVDIDEDGNISFEEFLDFMEVHYENADTDKNGKTTLGEIRSVLATALKATGSGASAGEAPSSKRCKGSCASEVFKGDGDCDEVNNCRGCAWDGGDCADPDAAAKKPAGRCKGKCASQVFKGDGDCDEVNNCRGCAWDGGDCADPDAAAKKPAGRCKGKCGRDLLKGDGDCDETNNCGGCDWDGGDCTAPKGEESNYEGTVHILHIAKTGGLSLRNAIGCSCPDQGGRKHCELTSNKGLFVCHGHEITCHDIPADEPYAVVYRNPITRFFAANRYQTSISTEPRSLESTFLHSPHQRPQHEYTNCDHAPAFVGHLETIAEDYQAFRAKFKHQCADAECAQELPHDHNLSDKTGKSVLPNDLRSRFFMKYGKDFSLAKLKK